MSTDLASVERDLATLAPTLARGLEIVATRTLGDIEDARDATQETLARAFAAAREGRIPRGVPLGAFVHGIARHVIADVLRRRERSRGESGDPAQLAAPIASSLDLLVRAEDAGHGRGGWQ